LLIESELGVEPINNALRPQLGFEFRLTESRDLRLRASKGSRQGGPAWRKVDRQQENSTFVKGEFEVSVFPDLVLVADYLGFAAGLWFPKKSESVLAPAAYA
jgi:hypothetical protein